MRQNKSNELDKFSRFVLSPDSVYQFVYPYYYNPHKPVMLNIKMPQFTNSKLFRVKPTKDNEILDAIIENYRYCLENDIDPAKHESFTRMFKNDIKTIQHHVAEGSSKALTLKVIGIMNGLLKEDKDKIVKIIMMAIKHNYPLALFQFGLFEMLNNHVDRSYYEFSMALERGEYLALPYLAQMYIDVYPNIPYAYTFSELGATYNLRRSYYHLGMLHIGGYAPRNLNKAIECLEKANKQSNYEDCPRLLQILKDVRDHEVRFKRQRETDLMIDDLQEAWIIENHLRCMAGNHQLIQDRYSGVEDFLNYFDTKVLVFYVAQKTIVIGHMAQLLVVNQQNRFERICIYFDGLIVPNLNLLSCIGTKITLKFFNRRIAFDGMLTYNVRNTEVMTIEPSDRQCGLTLEKIREVAKRFYSFEMYDRSIFLYEYLLTKQKDQESKLCFNISLCYSKMEMLKQSLSYALRSLKYDIQNTKSQYRVAYLMWRNGCLEDAWRFVEKINDKEAEDLKKMIKRELDAKAQHLDFSSKLYCRISQPEIKKLYFNIKLSDQLSIYVTQCQIDLFTASNQRFIRKLLKFNGDFYELQKKVRKLINLHIYWMGQDLDELKELFALVYSYLRSQFQYRIYSANQYLEYVRNYSNNQFMRSLVIRHTHLENRLQTAILHHLGLGHTQKAMELCRVGLPWNHALAYRLGQLLRTNNQPEKCQQLMTEMIKENSSYVNKFRLLRAKVRQSLGRYEQSNSDCYAMKNTMVNSFILSLNYYYLGNYEQSLEWIDQCTSTHYTHQALIHKLRLHVKFKMYPTALKLIELFNQIIDKQSERSKHVLRKASLNIQLKIYKETKNIGQFVRCCVEICQIDEKNKGFIQDRIWQWIQADKEIELELLKELKNHQELSCILEDIIERRHEEELDTADSEEEQEVVSEVEQATPVMDEDSLISLQYQGYVTHFRHNHRLYIILFDQNLVLDPVQQKRFRRAASNGFCRRNIFSNGVKFINSGIYTIKIKSDYRLIGTAEEQERQTILTFDRRENHSQAKRSILRS